ncbi:MAG: RNA polymerase sigma factor, partial [Chloroflexia bacterium]
MKDPAPDLLERCREHDPEAFACLVREQQDYVYTLALRMLRDPEEAADLTQEIFLRVWQALPSFRGESRFTTWLYRIATNACLNRLRELRLELGTVSLEEVPAEVLPSSEADPDREAWERERNALLWGAVERLRTGYRLVVTLFYQHGLPVAEIARVLGIPAGTVRTYLHRAREALAELLARG